MTSGTYEGRLLRVDRQPWSRLWLDACDDPQWQELVATGPSQSGKTLLCFVVPTLYHLFEIVERVICGVPDMEIAKDKWYADLLPMIERTRYRDLLPVSGRGGRGGFSQRVQFANGASLKWMSAGGGDKSRASYTSRVLIVTETDGIAKHSAGSHEADAMIQMEARLRSYANKRIYKEGTLTVEEGHTWQRYQIGTASKIVLKCPLCHGLVTPEREDFNWVGDTVQEAAKSSSFLCPKCSQPWNFEQRTQANRDAVLAHRGQEITPDGQIVGTPADTNVFGFRWSAVNNLLIDSDTIAIDEYNAQIAPDEDNAQRMMHQFVWALPYKSDAFETTKIDEAAVAKKQVTAAKGIVPAETQLLTAAADIHKRWIYYLVMAWSPKWCHVVDYERYDLRRDCTEDEAINEGLIEVDKLLSIGFITEEGDRRQIDALARDAGYKINIVTTSGSADRPFRVVPFLGRGVTQDIAKQRYFHPKASKAIRKLGEEWHVVYDRERRRDILVANVDHWKTWAHARISEEPEKGCPLTLFAAPPNKHKTFIRHLSAEHSESDFEPGKGTVVRWIKDRANNHYLDCLVMNCVLSSMLGFRLTPRVDRKLGRRKKQRHRDDFYRMK